MDSPTPTLKLSDPWKKYKKRQENLVWLNLVNLLQDIFQACSPPLPFSLSLTQFSLHTRTRLFLSLSLSLSPSCESIFPQVSVH